jgi:hypothetical protein
LQIFSIQAEQTTIQKTMSLNSIFENMNKFFEEPTLDNPDFSMMQATSNEFSHKNCAEFFSAKIA